MLLRPFWARRVAEVPKAKDLIRGERILLRPLGIEEAEGSYLQWMNDPQVTRHLESRFRTWSGADLKAYIQKQAESEASSGVLAVVRCDNYAHIGNIKLEPINWTHRTASVGLMIGAAEARGKGFGTEAIRLVVEYAFQQLGLRKLTAGIYASNHASIKAFVAAGFVVEGRQREQWQDEDDYVDGVLVGILQRDWAAAR